MTSFDKYVAVLEETRQKELNRAMNAEIASRLKMRTEEDAYAALLSLSLFAPPKREWTAALDAAALSV